MTAKKIKTVAVEKGDYKIFLKKAVDLYDIMLKARDTGNWTAVGLNAVHCAISISDAILVKYGGIRSIDSDHMVVVDIMRQKLNLKDIDARLASFRRMLSKKSLIEYDNTVFTKNDAMGMMKQLERYYIWAREELLK